MSGVVDVAHVITRLDVGGAQETVVRICAGLDRSRFRPVLLTGADRGSGGGLHDRAAAGGIEVVEVPTLRGPVRPPDDVRAVGDLARMLRDRGVGLVHTHSSKAGALGRMAARRAGVGVVVHTVHGWSFNDTQRRPVAAAYRGIERAMARRSDALVVVTPADARTGIAAGIGRPEQYALVRSGIPLDVTGRLATRHEVRARQGWAADEHVVVSVGRLEPQKDPLALVAAVAAARAEAPLRLVLVGGGSLEGEVGEAVAAAGLTGHVDLLGVRDDVPDLLAGADSFALSSRWEGLPRAVLEGVRAGLPVVATDTGGVSEVIETGRTGWLVPAGDGRGLARSLVEVSRDPGRAAALATAARGRLDGFTEATMVASTERLYASLLAGRGVPSDLAPEVGP